MQWAETMRCHWAKTAGPKAQTADPSLEREYRRIRRALPKGDTTLLNFYGGVTAALKQVIELQPAAESRSFQVLIDGERTRQSQGVNGGSFRLCVTGSPCPIRDVNGTRGVDSQKAVPVIHKDAFPDPLPFMPFQPH